MEDVFLSLTEPQQEWFADQVEAAPSLRDYITQLITAEYDRTHHQHSGPNSQP